MKNLSGRLKSFRKAISSIETSADALEVHVAQNLANIRQTLWELLVESGLPPNRFLQIYDEGADIYGSSSRVTYPDALPTDQVLAVPLEGCIDHLSRDICTDVTTFDRFVRLEGSRFVDMAPYDACAVTIAERLAVLPIERVKFKVRGL